MERRCPVAPARRSRLPLGRAARLLVVAAVPLMLLPQGGRAAAPPRLPHEEHRGMDAVRPATAAVRVLLRTINHDRALFGASPVTLDARLSACAHRHSVHLATGDGSAHDQLPQDICVRHTWFGENTGQAPQVPQRALPLLDRMMMDEGPCPQDPCSPAQLLQHGHYLNLMNPKFTRVGIGVYYADGATWLTEDFVG